MTTPQSELQRILLRPDQTILDALQAMCDTVLEIALVVDPDRVLLGTVTDGDIRRALLQQTPLTGRLDSIMKRTPITARQDLPNQDLLFLMTKHSIKHIPILDPRGRVVSLRRLQDMLAPVARDNWAVVMAGGLGKRLGDLTRATPKPLLPVGERPLLATIVQHLARHGIERVFLAIHHLGQQIKEYFALHPPEGIVVAFLEEQEFLGTAGPLSLLPERPKHPLLVMNGDILSPLNLGNLLDYHQASGREMTVCTREFSFRIPYGVVVNRGMDLFDIEEKPEQQLVINAGIYVLNPGLLDLLERGKPCDMPDLIRRAVKGGTGVACFPLSEFWLDIGHPTDYQQAQVQVSQVFPPRG